MLNPRSSISAVAAFILIGAACSPAADAPDPEVTAAPQDQAATVQAAPGCYLARGTMAEAAERASPRDSASVVLGGGEAKVCYGSPSRRDRVVMGELVPYGSPWRAGADEATSLYLTFPAEVAGVSLEPGAYSLYVVPTAEAWEVVLNRTHERWGIPINEEVRSADIGSGTVQPESTDQMTERMSYRFDRVSENEARLILEWENTRVPIPVVRTD